MTSTPPSKFRFRSRFSPTLRAKHDADSMVGYGKGIAREAPRRKMSNWTQTSYCARGAIKESV